MEAIFSSKLYKASRRKDTIHAALNNPINAELVQQLREYLDEEPVPKATVLEPSKNTSPETDSDTEEVVREKVPEPKPTDTSADHIGKAVKHQQDLDKALKEDLGDPAVVDEPEEPESEETAESNVSPAGDRIVASIEASDSVIGLLNSKSDTSGVLRVSIKGDEFWIYYQDKYNLNSIMTPVINLLEGAGYLLAFNRLARTDNAIVFDIMEGTESGVRDGE